MIGSEFAALFTPGMTKPGTLVTPTGSRRNADRLSSRPNGQGGDGDGPTGSTIIAVKL